MRRLAAAALLVLAFGLERAVPAGASEDGPDLPITFDQCREQLLSGDFMVVDTRKDSKPLPHVANMLAGAVQGMIDRKGSKDEAKARERFDRFHDEILERILGGKWGFDETSENILDDCNYAFHPDEDPAD